ncbi:MAG: aminoglycoside phosphotransferase family protein [Akkermansiaceae bacterium]|nr:aminoglycoside phosphotransferase family protein [Akkermansiaceae bacterium]
MDYNCHIEKIANDFAIAGVFIKGEEIHSGHINATYIATFETEDGLKHRYIFQRINEKVFRDPLAVMRNVEMVTHHINLKVMRVKRDVGGQTLNLYPARKGGLYVSGAGGGIWRCYNFIEGCRTYEIVENTRQAYQAAHAFGSFQDLVSDIPLEGVEETIPDFHNTPKRYERLMDVADRDLCSRRASVAVELEFIQKRQWMVSKLVDLQRDGLLPTRVTHNDTKINNVMMDVDTDEAVCVIDLDTVMPGLSLYDFGDLVRTAVSPAAEDEPDLSEVLVRMPMFEALAEGYIDACHCLCDAELDNLAFAGSLISLETGMRFLTDYLEGDVYFKTQRDGQNLDRARTQLKLVDQLEQKQGEMQAFVNRVAKARR